MPHALYIFVKKRAHFFSCETVFWLQGRLGFLEQSVKMLSRSSLVVANAAKTLRQPGKELFLCFLQDFERCAPLHGPAIGHQINVFWKVSVPTAFLLNIPNLTYSTTYKSWMTALSQQIFQNKSFQRNMTFDVSLCARCVREPSSSPSHTHT